MKQLTIYFQKTAFHNDKWPPVLLNMAKAAFKHVPFTTVKQAINQQPPVTVKEIAYMQEQNRYYRYTNVVTKQLTRKAVELN